MTARFSVKQHLARSMQERSVIKLLFLVLLLFFGLSSIYESILPVNLQRHLRLGTSVQTERKVVIISTQSREYLWPPKDRATIDLGSIDEAMIEKRMELTRNRVAQVCEDLRPSGIAVKIHPKYMVFDPVHSVAYCSIPKVASSSWTFNMLTIAGLKGSKYSHVRAPMELPFPANMSSEHFAQHVTSLVVVRHPFSRLASVFFSKLVKNGRKSWERLRLFIIWKFRGDPRPKGHFESWSQERLLLEERNRTKDEPVLDVNHPNNAMPEEFCRYILFVNGLKAARLDIHMRPQYQICPFCRYNFTLYSHLENLGSDAKYFLKRAKVAHLQPKMVHLNLSKEFGDKERTFWSQVKHDTIQSLHQMYFYDFELFNFSLPGYFSSLGIEYPTPSVGQPMDHE